MYSGLKGNVSTYRLDQSQITAMIDGNILPPEPKILAATIGVTFVGPKNLPEWSMPNNFRVRRERVRVALEWLKVNNALYNDITISDARLQLLPEDGVPMELISTAKHSTNMEILNEEHDGYVPESAKEDEEKGKYRISMLENKGSFILKL